MNKLLLLLFFILIFGGCSVSTVKEFYVLSYNPAISKPDVLKTKKKYPLPLRVEVADFDINRVYDRNAIVIRQSLHKMVFDEKQLWAYRPHKALTELLITHINAAGLFAECKSEFFDTSADYSIIGRVNNIEKYQNELMSFAFISVDLTMLDKNKTVILTKNIRRDIKLEGNNTAFFVKSLSDIFKEEFADFINSTFLYFESLPL